MILQNCHQMAKVYGRHETIHGDSKRAALQNDSQCWRLDKVSAQVFC